MKYAYKDLKLRGETLKLIRFLNELIDDYTRQGFTLSVRQLYYQLVSRDMVENTEKSYKRVASIINDGRIAGLIDWDAIEDRNRDIEVRPHWESGADIVQGSASQFYMDMWDNQPHRIFVIVEKAALAGVLGGVCRRHDVPLLAARGYPSVSIMRELVLQHVKPAIDHGQEVTVLHLGDHDPSGIDMTRDLEERINLFMEDDGFPDLNRIALTMKQIDEVNPPPNPAKTTDSRFNGYRRIYGDESWELDALEPSYLVNLVQAEFDNKIDVEAWEERAKEITQIRAKLQRVADTFDTL